MEVGALRSRCEVLEAQVEVLHEAANIAAAALDSHQKQLDDHLQSLALVTVFSVGVYVLVVALRRQTAGLFRVVRDMAKDLPS